jgi:hypothetical protein
MWLDLAAVTAAYLTVAPAQATAVQLVLGYTCTRLRQQILTTAIELLNGGGPL